MAPAALLQQCDCMNRDQCPAANQDVKSGAQQYHALKAIRLTQQ